MPGLPLRCRAGAEVGAIREKGVLESSACSRSREAWESTRLKTGLTVPIENRPSRRFKPCPRHQNILTIRKTEKAKSPLIRRNHMPTVSFYKIALLLSLTALSTSVAGMGYYYQYRTTNLNNQVATLNTQNDSQHDQIDSLKSQIANLTQQINHLSDDIHQLQSTNSQLLDQIIQLRGQIGGLCTSGKTITIGELTDLTDGLSNIGIPAKESSMVAVSDVNSLLSSGGCNLKFSLGVYDYALDNPRALTGLQSFSASGVQVVIGPLNSGTAQYILPFANSNHILLVSPSSSSTALCIPNDYLFRTAPTDAAQGRADARMMFDRGARAVIIVQRHDGYGISVGDATAMKFTSLGGKVIDTIQYDATSSSTTDFTPVLQTVQNDFNQNVGTYGPDKIALYFVSFEELGSLVIQASHQSGFPRTQLPWFGADGTTLDPVLTGNATTGPLLAQLRYTSPQFYTVNNTKTLQFYHRFNSLHPGQSCDQYCLGAYDDVWLSALATLQAGSYDGTKIQAIISTVASNYYGLTGWTEFDTNGDRVPPSYQIWKIAIEGSASEPSWVLAGTWDASSDSITWLAPP